MKKGDRVVCIKDHSQGVIKKGQEFTVTGTYNSCKCCLSITIGIVDYGNFSYCCKCDCLCKSVSNQLEFDVCLFRKIEEQPFTNSLTKELSKKAIERSIEKVDQPELV